MFSHMDGILGGLLDLHPGSLLQVFLHFEDLSAHLQVERSVAAGCDLFSAAQVWFRVLQDSDLVTSRGPYLLRRDPSPLEGRLVCLVAERRRTFLPTKLDHPVET